MYRVSEKLIDNRKARIASACGSFIVHQRLAKDIRSRGFPRKSSRQLETFRMDVRSSNPVWYASILGSTQTGIF